MREVKAVSDSTPSVTTPTTRARELHEGQTLGRYQLLLPVAAGGMGQVWAARQLGSIGMRRLVAIKTALPKLERSEEFERLFLDEGRIAAAIHHPNVCTVYDIGEQDGELFIAMEWVDGGALSTVLRSLAKRGESLPIRIAARIVSQACSGLHAAHELRNEAGELLDVVHRDVSPQNILLTALGHVKVADFGIAKANGQLRQATQTGEFRGKVWYMAPEQFIAKHSVDRRVDIYALGCVFYELLTSQKPFDAEDQVVLMYRVVEGSYQKPRERRADIPQELEDIIAKAMAHKVEDRYATAEEMGRAIEEWLVTSGTIVTDADIASLVRATCGGMMEARRRKTQEAIERLGDTAEGSVRNLLSSRAPTDDSQPSLDSAETPLATAEVTASTQAGVGVRRSRVLAAAIGAAAGFVVISALAGLRYRERAGHVPAVEEMSASVALTEERPSSPPLELEAPEREADPSAETRTTIAPSVEAEPVPKEAAPKRGSTRAGGGPRASKTRAATASPPKPANPATASVTGDSSGGGAPLAAAASSAPSAPTAVVGPGTLGPADLPGRPRKELDTENPYSR